MDTGTAITNLTAFLILPGIIGMIMFLVAVIPKRKSLLISVASSLIWLAIGFWWISGALVSIGISGTYAEILMWIPFLFFFIILLEYMTRVNQVEITSTLGGRQWSEMGTPPSTYVSNYDKYKRELQGKTRKRGRR